MLEFVTEEAECVAKLLPAYRLDIGSPSSFEEGETPLSLGQVPRGCLSEQSS
jgi:hypothetical protein